MMNVFKDFETGRFYNADCRESLREMCDGTVDCVVTSPPYDDLRSYGGGDSFTFDVFIEVAKHLERVLKKGGVIVWNVADATKNGSETCSSFRQALFFKDVCKLNLHDTMIYSKLNYVPLTHNRYEQAFEYMFVFSKGSPKTFNPIMVDCKYAGEKRTRTFYQSAKDESPKPGHAKNDVKNQKIKNNVWALSNNSDLKGAHPAQFPLSIPTDHIVSWTNENELILDPFSGSGTTAIAAINTSRRWVCIERNETYYSKAIARIQKCDVPHRMPWQS